MWWLFLHRRLRSRQRGSSLSLERLCYPLAVLSKGRDPFLSGRFRKVLRLSLAGLSASTRSVVETPSACCFSPTLRHRNAPLLLIGHDAREHCDRVRIIRTEKRESSRKHIKYWAVANRMAVENAVEIIGPFQTAKLSFSPQDSSDHPIEYNVLTTFKYQYV